MKSKKGFIFKKFEAESQSPFDRLFDIFKELITHTSGDFDEAINWLKELDKEYNLTNEDYSIEDFVEELKEKGYVKEEIDVNGDGNISLTAKTEQAIRQQALNQIFGKIKKMELAIIKATNKVKETNTLVTSGLFSLEIP